MDSLEQIKRRRDLIRHLGPFLRAVRSMAEIAYRRAQSSVPPLDAYSDQVHESLALVQSEGSVAPLPPTSKSDSKTVGIVIVTSERGFCGRFPDSAVEHGLDEARRVAADGGEARLICLGSRGRRILETHGHETAYYKPLSSLGATSYAEVETIAIDLLEMYESGQLDQLVICANEATGRFSFAPKRRTLWPPEPVAEAEPSQSTAVSIVPEYDSTRLLTHLLTESLLLGLYRVILHSSLAEQLARISAMDSAARNAENLVDDLSLEYLVRSRQEETTALMEIVAGYEVSTTQKVATTETQ